MMHQDSLEPAAIQFMLERLVTTGHANKLKIILVSSSYQVKLRKGLYLL